MITIEQLDDPITLEAQYFKKGKPVAPPANAAPVWANANQDIVTLAAVEGNVNRETLAPITVGNAQISVTVGSLSANATITVTAATPDSVQIVKV